MTMPKKAKLLDSMERLECDSKEDGIRVEEEDEQRSETVDNNFDLEFEGMGSVEKLRGLFLEKPVSQETDGILEGWSGKEREEIHSGCGSTEDGVSLGSESLNGANDEIENGKAGLDFDLNYPISDVVTNANHGTGYTISNPIIVDSDSENSLSSDDDDDHQLYGALDVVGEESSFELELELELESDNRRLKSSFYGEESRFAAKKIRHEKEKAQLYDNDDEETLELGLGLMPKE